jgi:hypothetical protein
MLYFNLSCVIVLAANLTLKIPWKNLYTEPVIASIDGLYALALPNVGKSGTVICL